MKLKLYFGFTVVFGSVVFAQNSSAPSPEQGTYVHRFSLGATLNVLGITPVKKNTSNVVTTTPALDTLYTTTDASQRIGYGATAQLMFTRRIGINASLVVRRPGYIQTDDIIAGVDNPATPQDERVHTTRHEDTRARFYDLPITLRYYGKSRFAPGPRWFLDLGGALRRVQNIRSFTYTTDPNEAVVCCTYTPTAPARRRIAGFVAGFGVLVKDPVGVRLAPEIRYTHWMGTVFDNASTMTRREQLEGMLSISF